MPRVDDVRYVWVDYGRSEATSNSHKLVSAVTHNLNTDNIHIMILPALPQFRRSLKWSELHDLYKRIKHYFSPYLYLFSLYCPAFIILGDWGSVAWGKISRGCQALVTLWRSARIQYFDCIKLLGTNCSEREKPWMWETYGLSLMRYWFVCV